MVRIKHRYLLVNILYPDVKKSGNPRSSLKTSEDVPYSVQIRRPSSPQMDSKILIRLIKDAISELFGDYGSGMIAGSLQIKYFSQATSTAIIRVSRDHYRLVWAALTFTTHLPKPVDQPCVIQVIRVSGTIKKAEEEAIRRARKTIRQAQSGVNGHLKAILDVTATDAEHGAVLVPMSIEDEDEGSDEGSDERSDDGDD